MRRVILLCILLVTTVLLGIGQEAQLNRFSDLKNGDFYSIDDSTIRGESVDYEIINHAPQSFKLLDPHHGEIIELVGFSTPQIFITEPSLKTGRVGPM